MKSPKLTPGMKRLVDEYAEVRQKVAAWRPPANPHAARLKELEGAIADLADKAPADEEVLLVGYHFVVPVGMRRVKRTIVEVAKLFKRLGMEWVYAHCQPNLGDVDKALSEDERKAFISESRELSRIIGTPVTAQVQSKAA